jgi:hypothetical protein
MCFFDFCCKPEAETKTNLDELDAIGQQIALIRDRIDAKVKAQKHIKVRTQRNKKHNTLTF